MSYTIYHRFSRRSGAVKASLIAAALLTGSALAGGGSIAARADTIGDSLASTVTSVAPSIVSLRVTETVTQTQGGQSHSQDATADFKGVIVSPDGLVMCTNSYISGQAVNGAFGVPADAAGQGISISPEEIRITVGNESTEYYGTVAATDSTLGLSFIQIRDLNGRQLPFVNLGSAAAAPVNIGDVAVSVTRLDKSFDYAPIAVSARIVSLVAKPRRAYLPDSDAASLGLPVYVNGALVGVETFLPPGDRTQEDAFTEFIASRFEDSMNERQTEFIVPVENVAPLIDLAKKQAAALPPFTTPKPRTASPATIAPAKAATPGPVPVPAPPPATTPTKPAAPASAK